MTQEDIDKEVGKTDRELREAKARLAALQAKAQRLENVVESLALALRGPEGMIFDNQAVAEQFITVAKRTFKDEDFTDLNPESLKNLGDAVRQETKTIQQLASRLRKLRGEI